MSSKNSGQGNNQSGATASQNSPATGAADGNKTPADGAAAADAMAIPRFGAGEPAARAAVGAGPVVQEGEDAAALGADVSPVIGAPPKAVHRPVFVSPGREIRELTDNDLMTVPLPELAQRLQDMARTDLRIEAVGDANLAKHAEELAFLEEYLIIRVSEANQLGEEDPILLSVNGSPCPVPRGRDVILRRKFVELLMRAKPEAVNTRMDRSDPDNIKNFIDKRAYLKYPFQIIRDDNPKSRAWVQRVMGQRN